MESTTLLGPDEVIDEDLEEGLQKAYRDRATLCLPVLPLRELQEDLAGAHQAAPRRSGEAPTLLVQDHAQEVRSALHGRGVARAARAGGPRGRAPVLRLREGVQVPLHAPGSHEHRARHQVGEGDIPNLHTGPSIKDIRNFLGF